MMKRELKEKILSDLENGYDSIADKFSETRTFMWRDLEFIRDYIKPGDKVLDFGCGNGRLAGFLENNYKEFVGVDISQKMINIAEDKYGNDKTKFIKLKSDFEKLPFSDNSFGTIISIAVFHHLPGKEYRMQIARELYRVLRPNGKLIITIWNLWQKRFWKYHLRLSSGKGFDWKDFYIPFKDNQGNIFQRYHHAFTAGEIEKHFRCVGFKRDKIIRSKNILYIGHKSAVDKKN